MESINYKLEEFEGPLELLLTLVDKNKMKIEDIPIDILCEQYIEYIKEAEKADIALACEFIYMASELMLIKSRMLLPRDPKTDDDPRQTLIDALLEYQKAKLAATELSDLYSLYGTRMIKETDDISVDKTYVASHSVNLLTAALTKVLAEVKMSEKTLQKSFTEIVNAPQIPVEDVIHSLIGSLREKPICLEDFFLASRDRREMIAKFMGILELIKSQIITISDDEPDESGITDVLSHAKLTLTASDSEIDTFILNFGK